MSGPTESQKVFEIRRLSDLNRYFDVDETAHLPGAVAARIRNGQLRLMTRSEHWLERLDDTRWKEVRKANAFAIRVRFRDATVERRVDFPTDSGALDELIGELKGEAQHLWEETHRIEAPTLVSRPESSPFALPALPNELRARAEYLARITTCNKLWEEFESLPTRAAIVLALFTYNAIPPGIRRIRFRKMYLRHLTQRGKEPDFDALKEEKRRETTHTGRNSR